MKAFYECTEILKSHTTKQQEVWHNKVYERQDVGRMVSTLSQSEKLRKAAT